MAGRNFDYPHPLHGKFARQQLAQIARDANALHAALRDEDAFPAWVQQYIATSGDRLSRASQYMTHVMQPITNLNGSGLSDLQAGTVDLEPSVLQPARAFGALVGGPIVLLAAERLPPEAKQLKVATFLVGASMMIGCAWAWLVTASTVQGKQPASAPASSPVPALDLVSLPPTRFDQ